MFHRIKCLDQIGSFTKDVTDCAIVLNAIAGYDKMDSTSVDADKTDYTKALGLPLKGMKVGVPKQYLESGIQAEIREAVENAIKVYEILGAEFEKCSLPLSKYALPAYYLISSEEASSNLARFDGIKYGYRAENYHGLTDLYERTRS